MDILSALGEYRIGELYRSDHDYTRALAHLCTGHDLLLHAGQLAVRLEGPPPDVRFPRLEVHLRLGKGTAYFETGEMTRALKWHVHAWSSLEDLIDRETERQGLEPQDRPIERHHVEALAEYLDGIKHEPDLNKDELKFYLRPGRRSCAPATFRSRLARWRPTSSGESDTSCSCWAFPTTTRCRGASSVRWRSMPTTCSRGRRCCAGG